jgi:hypothetical protein
VNGFSFSDRHLPLPYWLENNNNNKKKVPGGKIRGEEGEWVFEEEIQRDERESHFHVDKALHAHKTCAYGYIGCYPRPPPELVTGGKMRRKR